jgi:hypothetical protein
MGARKKFNAQIGFLWDTAQKEKVLEIATKKGVDPSDIYREGMKMYLDVIEGRATYTLNRVQDSQPEAVTEPAIEKEPEKVIPEGGTVTLPPSEDK